jgi:hypothetical protein
MPEPTAWMPVAARYTRSVHLARDFDDRERALAGYQATPLVRQTIGRILAGLHPDSTTRAFSLVGVYGTGKSAFGLFLAHYLALEPGHRNRMVEDHATTDEVVPLGYDGPPFFPVLVSGQNRSLRSSLLSALLDSWTRRLPEVVQNHEMVQEIQSALQDNDPDPGHITDLFVWANQWIATQTDYGGMVIIIDELGQYLDYLFHRHEERDLFVLQALAETAARSGSVPMLLLTILHQAFDRYAPTAGIAQRTEWKKVQGRFIDLPFQEPDSQMMLMIGQALCPDRTEQEAPHRVAWADSQAPQSETLGLRPAAIALDEWPNLLKQTWLLHPTVLVILPILFRHLAQNERSLFSFLTSQEPWSFHDMLHSSQGNGSKPAVYRLPHLFAYVEATMGPGLYSRVHGRRWAELIEALACIPETDQQRIQVLTTIGTLNALGQHHRVRASESLVSFALQDTLDGSQTLETIQQLERQQHIIYRRHRDSYLLWQGSDLDLDGLVQAALRTMGDQPQVAKLLQQSTRTRPMVARQHSYRTGAVRHFIVRFVEGEALSLAPDISDRVAGEIWYLVPADDESLQHARQWAASPDRAAETRRMVVIPQRIRHITDLLLEVSALQQVLTTQPELEHDRVAHRELASRLVEAQQMLDEAVTWTYHSGSGAWWWRGQPQTVQTMRQLDDLLSEACDTIYSESPRIWNELIVRHHLSSASSKARRNLIEAMLDHGQCEGVALEGYPPEQAIYESVFKASGIHRLEADGRWHFGPPLPEHDNVLNLSPVWNAIQAFIASTHQHKKPVTELFALMEAPPYGVKAGLVPLLFMALYLANAGEIALYEHGSYVTIPDMAVFERLMRHPSYFSIRQFQSGGVRMKVYERLASVLAPHALDRAVQPALLDAVNPLLRFIRKLPEYSQHTQNVSEQAQSIRRALLHAQEPDIVLFVTLARACGVEPFATDAAGDIAMDDIEPFFASLRTGIMELQEAYPRLIGDVAASIRCAFAAQSTDHVLLYEELHQRIRQIIEVTSDTQIRALGVRLEHAPTGDAWIESVGELVARKPMTYWRDADVADFKRQIADLGQRFGASEKVAAATQAMPPEARAMHIRCTDAEGEYSRVVWNRQPNSTMQWVQSQIASMLQQSTELNDEQRVQMLVDLLRPLLQPTEERETDHE